MLDLDDIDEVDHESRLNLLRNQINQEIRALSSQLVFPPPVRTAVAMGSIAGHYFGVLPAIAGAIVGFRIHKNKRLTDVDRKVIMNKINAKRKQLEQLEQVDAYDSQAIEGIMSATDLMNYSYDQYEFTGKWERFMGKPQVGFHAMVFGIPKSGKSILCTQLARYLADNFGSVLYVAAEEGFSLTLQNKLREFGSECENLHYANFREFDHIRTALQNNDFNFVFLDSVNFMKITPEQLRQLKQENQGVSFITIQQATKDGKFRGSQEYAHDADVIINVANGEAHQQGRFREPSIMRVFKKGSYNPEPEYADDGDDDDQPVQKNEKPSLGDGLGAGFDMDY
jgi:hypothetical protein